MADNFNSNGEREAKVVLVAQTDDYNRKIEESQKATNKFVKSLEKVSETSEKIVKKTSKGLFKIGAAEIASLTALSAVAARLDKQTSNIQSNLALNKSSSQFNAVTNAIRDMSRTIPMARAEIAGMATEVSNLGFVSSEQTSRVTKQFSKMGIATGEDARALAANTVQFQRAMGVSPSADTMEPVSEATTLLSAQAGVPANDIISFAGSIAPAARVAGLEQSSVLGLATAASRAGVDGLYASSTIQQILNDITALRYTKSPEMRRYSTALGMPLNELLGDVDNPDTFNRNIISKIIATSQTAEGPSRMSLLGFDGLRAQRALQGLASEPGGVEQWIRRAEYGRGTESVEVGFEAASSGLNDELTMLRNRATDVGQDLGTPTMEAFTNVAKAMNFLAETVQPLTSLISKLTGAIGPIVGTVTMLGGAMYGAWRTFSTLSLIKRGAINTTTSSLVSGFLEGQRIGRGEDTSVPINTMSRRVTEGRASGWQSTMYGIGSGVGTAVPNARVPRSPLQAILMRTRQVSEGVTQATQDWYRKARINDPGARYDLAQEQRRIDRIITPEHGLRPMNRAELKERADNYRRLQEWQRTAHTRGATRYPGMDQAVIGPMAIPDMHVFDPAERETIRGTARSMARGFVRTPWEAAKFGLTQPVAAYRLTRDAMSAHRETMRMQRVEAAAAGQPIPSRMGAIGRGVSSMVSPQMLAMAGGMYAFNLWNKADDYTKRWREGGKGLDGEVLNNLTKYNEKLGIATKSLERFSTSLDETNPARTADVQKELSDRVNTYRVGASSDYEMADENLKAFGHNVNAAKEYLSQFDQLNADQAVTIFRDFAKLFNEADWKKIRDWYLSGVSDSGVREDTAPPPSYMASADSMITEARESMGLWSKFGTKFLGGQEPILPWTRNIDFYGLHNPETAQLSTTYIGSAMAYGQSIGETREFDIPGLEGVSESEAIATGAKIQNVVKALDALNEVYVSDTSLTGVERQVAKAQWMQAKDRAGEVLGQLDMTGIDAGEGSTEKVQERIWSELAKQAREGSDQAKALIDNELVTATGTFDFNSLPGKKVTTTIDQMLDMSKFADMDKSDRDKWFGRGTTLGDMAVGITDPIKQLVASMKLLTMAQDEFGGSVQETDSALQSLKSGLSANDANWAIVAGAQQLNEMLYGQFEIAGGGAAGWTDSYQRRSQFEQEAAQSENPPTDTQERLIGLVSEGQSKIIEWYQRARDYEKSTMRQTEDFNRQMEMAGEDYIRSVEYAQEDHHKQMRRSRDAYHRQMAHSEAAYHRQLKYQQQDFYRSRRREQEAHDRQMKYAAEDTAKQIGDPYNRIQLQLLSDPEALISNMGNRAEIAQIMTSDIERLRKRGLSEQAMQQLNVFDFNNSQQTHHLANTITNEDIERFNKLARSLVGLGGQISGEDTSLKRSEREREIALQQGLNDFLRGLRRTKIEHDIQVRFSKKEFRIGIDQAQEDYEKAMQRAGMAFKRAQERAVEGFHKSMRRQADDLVDYYETYAKTQQEMVEETKRILGSVASKGSKDVIKMINTADREVNSLISLVRTLGTEVESAMNKIHPGKLKKLLALELADDVFAAAVEAARTAAREAARDAARAADYAAGGGGHRRTGYGSGSSAGRGASTGSRVYLGSSGGTRAYTGLRNAISATRNEPGMCLAHVSRWYGDAPSGVSHALSAWSKSTQKHYGDKHPPAGVPVYWGGGLYGHVAMSIGAGLVRSTDWPRSGQVGTTSISQLSSSWNKPYLGWAGDTWGKKLAEGGVVKAKNGGVNVTVAEAGSDEAVIPIDRRGVDFMAMFAKAVAQQLVVSMPRTPATNTASHITNDHSTNMRIDKVTVETQDPKRFMRELQMEASKKRAALYKSSFSGVETT